MTIQQVLKKNEHVTILDDSFRVFTTVFTAPYNNFLVYTNGDVYLRTDSSGSYKKSLQTTKDIIDKMPSDMPEFLKTPWTFSQQISDDEAEQLSKFLVAVYYALG